VLGSAFIYLGLVIAVSGMVLVVRPLRRLGVPTRPRAAIIGALGVVLIGVGFFLPVSESRIGHVETRLDEFAPAWQFHERHAIRIAAPPARVFDAIERVTADEISLFRTLTWIRRGGQTLPKSILDAPRRESLIDVATRAGFVRLADDAPRELVIGAVMVAPAGTRGSLTPQVFGKALPPGFALATMNFRVTAEGLDRSFVTTETRVYANSPSVRRRFAAYWRVIYPGSAIIRVMWLRAIQRRATAPMTVGEGAVSRHHRSSHASRPA